MTDWDEVNKKKEDSIVLNQAIKYAMETAIQFKGNDIAPETDLTAYTSSILRDFENLMPIYLERIKSVKIAINKPNILPLKLVKNAPIENKYVQRDIKNFKEDDLE